MNYIIDHANFVSDNGITIRSFFIDNNKIVYYGRSLEKYKALQMNVSSYFMTPGYVFCDFQLSSISSLQQFKDRLKHLIKKGCTTIIIPWRIHYESEFQKKIKQARHAMINSTLDYVIGVHLSVEKLTPTIVRLCKRNKVPFIVVDIPQSANIYSIPWGWLREAQYQYQIPIYPLWVGTDDKIVKEQRDLWEKSASLNRIPTYIHFPKSETPLSKVILKQIGLYPRKGELLIGNDLDYNLFIYGEEHEKVEDCNKLDYDKSNPIITVHKGRLLRVQDEMNYFPGFGVELIIDIPGLFGTIEIIS
ncbi:hypothetical protein [Calidifontibacillus oryziterrae]|uniref:hypothetical protein n=1 Tax=Calidifontibacillus oryziterrae TaxID=1191699 RepID=UPI0002FD2B4A|nr:hypothetical protein [Calidifontibacillus oryziterrae]